ncbi:MAG: flagellar hook-associated protein FlgK [Anaerolineales bacterium]
MPTISSGISIALQAVLTHSQVLEITEHNIANASTPGYRRQSAVLTAETPSSINGAEYSTGAGQRGAGVTIDRIQRFNLSYFDGRYRAVSSEAGNWEAQSSILSQLESTLAETSDDGLLPKLDQFWSGWQSLSNDPTNTSLRSILLDDASSLATAFNRRATQILQMRSDQNQVVSSQVEEINSLASDVAKLNENISRVISVGEQPNDLLDKRDVALDRLAKLTGAVSTEQKNGEVLVSVGGHVLVVGHDALRLETRTDPADTSIINTYWSDNQKLVPSSGELKGTLEVRDHVLVDQLNGLNTMSAGLIAQVNTIHSGGYGLNNATNLNFFNGTDALSIAVNSSLDAASIATSSAANQAGNNDIALQIAGLKTVKGMKAGTATLNEFYNSQITDLAVLTKRATDSSYQHGLVVDALGNQRESMAGVSLDEEAANMAKAQKAYQAAARVLTAYDDLLDLVINRMGRVGL